MQTIEQTVFGNEVWPILPTSPITEQITVYNLWKIRVYSVQLVLKYDCPDYTNKDTNTMVDGLGSHDIPVREVWKRERKVKDESQSYSMRYWGLIAFWINGNEAH